MKVEPVAWPLVESPGEFTNRLKKAYAEFGDLLAAVRHVMIENPPNVAIPPGYALVRVEPTEAMWGGLARDIMFVLRQERPTPKKLVTHLHALGHDIPDWLAVEIHDTNSDHVISKGTCCVLIYKAMLTAAAKGE